MSRMTRASSTDEASATWTGTTGTCSAPALPPPRSRHDPAQPKPRPRATAPPPRAGAARRPALTRRPPPVLYLGTGGLSWRELTAVVSSALRAGGCRGWSVGVYNPDLDPQRQSARQVVTFLAEVLG